MKTEGRRELLFDALKFLAITMVCVWHVIYRAADWDKCRLSYCVNFMLGVNMPLFFAISGYFSRGLMRELNFQKLLNRVVTYAWPIASFGLIVFVNEMHSGLAFAMGRCVNFIVFGAWFFWCLIFCECSVFVIHWIAMKWFPKRRKTCIIGGMIVLFLVIWCIPYGLWYAIAMMPFYWFGLYGLPQMLNQIKGNLVLGAVMICVYTCITLLQGNIITNGISFYWNRMWLLDFTVYGLLLMVARFVIGVIGILACIAAMQFLVRKISVFARMCESFGLGRYTLGIFFVHSFLIAFMFSRFQIEACSLKVLIGVVVCLLSHCIVALSSMIPAVKFGLWGPRRVVKCP